MFLVSKDRSSDVVTPPGYRASADSQPFCGHATIHISAQRCPSLERIEASRRT
jgi:hypothetical protein